ncbi:Pentacotripeptide-repeat region of PRORP domain-containing protein [Plasmodiophora brassicae]|uniref:Pentacotripeptide-repeat region of PRORP domain-containing protein n=1 Tax=Plasmodiophora brassicae TaxID=37360 RepID=A0A0G4J7Y9_PLABS|nr:hypothetical protein PBRA_009487 [Plasmodiophora brassicae]SPQ94389.1 unnamed protein product [Plasmodiophora brassicae]
MLRAYLQVVDLQAGRLRAARRAPLRAQQALSIALRRAVAMRDVPLDEIRAIYMHRSHPTGANADQFVQALLRHRRLDEAVALCPDSIHVARYRVKIGRLTTLPVIRSLAERLRLAVDICNSSRPPASALTAAILGGGDKFVVPDYTLSTMVVRLAIRFGGTFAASVIDRLRRSVPVARFLIEDGRLLSNPVLMTSCINVLSRDPTCTELVVKALVRAGAKVESVLGRLTELTPATYAELIVGFAAAGHVRELEILLGHPLHRTACTAQVAVAVLRSLQQRPALADAAMRAMWKAGIPLHAEAFRVLHVSYCMAGDIHAATAVLDAMKKLGIPIARSPIDEIRDLIAVGDAETVQREAPLTPTTAGMIASVYARRKQVAQLSSWSDQVQSRGIDPWASRIHLALARHDPATAVALADGVALDGLSLVEYRLLMRAYCQAGVPSSVQRCVDAMARSTRLPFDTSTRTMLRNAFAHECTFIIRGLMRAGRTDDALAELDHVVRDARRPVVADAWACLVADDAQAVARVRSCGWAGNDAKVGPVVDALVATAASCSDAAALDRIVALIGSDAAYVRALQASVARADPALLVEVARRAARPIDPACIDDLARVADERGLPPIRDMLAFYAGPDRSAPCCRRLLPPGRT